LPNISYQSFVAKGTDLFAGTSNGVYRSSDSGATWWTDVNIVIGSVQALAVCGTYLLAGISDTLGQDGVYRSTDNGDSWNPTGLISNTVQSFAVIGSQIFAGTRDSGVFRSSDNGTSWVQINNGLTNANVHSFAIIGPNIFAGSDSGGIYLSTDNGDSWTLVNSGLPNSRVYSLAIDGAFLYTGTDGNGVWKRPMSEMISPVTIQPSHKSPAEFGFALNSGSLIHSGERIQFSVNYRALVDISVFDISGKKVTTLVKTVMAPGIHQASFNISGLPGGLYFFRMKADGYNQTRRFVLEK